VDVLGSGCHHLGGNIEAALNSPWGLGVPGRVGRVAHPHGLRCLRDCCHQTSPGCRLPPEGSRRRLG